ncbi:MAG TPA: BlaI/MecI/CopY family transcriptional regulator [Egibacteraceae bacterium]|nr:BlaI/MecI/CopY family transcriptional regulator [Actinomycetota bacterium]HWB72876.1 BlaI/MecI/CopY family transcriptional regulator [Egibacteraceae bacterium]
MPKRRTQPEGLLGPLETEVMETVWGLGETTVREVHAELARHRDLAYTTIMTTMARLAAKALLVRDTSGLAHRYRPAVSREDYARSTVTSVVDWLVDSFPEPAISYFVEVIDDGTDPAVLDALRARIDRQREQEG